MRRLLIMAGEASGDQHGAKLARELKRIDPDVELLGLGGDKMQAAGVRLLEGIERLDIIGVPDWAELRQAVRTYRALSRRLQELRLDAVVLIDNPGLNLRLARIAKRAGHRVIYYIAPQIWAWRRKRIETIKQVVDLVLVILPFEEEIYRAAGVRCIFVGHPLMDEMALTYDRPGLRGAFGAVAPSGELSQIVGLLPGSRVREVRSLLPVMLDAAEMLTQRRPHGPGSLRFVLGQAQSIPAALIAEILAQSPVEVTVVRDQTFEVMAAADLLVVASGTATLQAAIVGTPMVIVYRTSRPTYWMGRAFIKLPWIGLANIVSGRQIAPELIQDTLTKERLTEEAERVLDDPARFAAAQEAAVELRRSLGAAGASHRAARAILDECAAPAVTPAWRRQPTTTAPGSG
jgi:lipid-A-disaccharide synthase